MRRLNQFAAAGLLLSAALSAPGEEWTKEPGIRVGSGNVPFVFPLDDGRFRLFFCGQGGIRSAISTDGLNFSIEAGVRTPG